MEEDEPDIKSENLADTDESPLGDTTEHAGEQDPDEGETYHDPEGEGEDAPAARAAARGARTAARAPAPARARAPRACPSPSPSSWPIASDGTTFESRAREGR